MKTYMERSISNILARMKSTQCYSIIRVFYFLTTLDIFGGGRPAGAFFTAYTNGKTGKHARERVLQLDQAQDQAQTGHPVSPHACWPEGRAGEDEQVRPG